MPSGAKILSRKYALSAWPLTDSTRRPAQSMLMLYSHLSPGSKTSGMRSAATLPVAVEDIPAGDTGVMLASSWYDGLTADGLTTPSSQHRAHETAVHEDRGPGDVARLARGEERHEVGQLLRLADAAHRGLGRALGQRLVDRDPELLGAVGHVRKHALAQDGAGAYVVDQDAVAPDLVCEALGERHDAHARGAGERQVRNRLVHGTGQDVDDAAGPLPLQVRQRLARHPREEQE